MSFSAGEVLTADKLNTLLPGTLVAETIIDTDGTSGTGEIVGASVTASLVSGRKYRVIFDTNIEGGAVDDRVVVRIRENNVSGTSIQEKNRVILHTSGTIGNPVRLEAFFTAVSTGAKTFVGTYDTSGLTGVNRAATASAPTLMYVELRVA